MFLVQLVIILVCIFIGARMGGLGLGVMGGIGLAILTFVFGVQPASPPIDVMLIIAAVVTAASVLQASGGMDYLVHLAEKALRRNPKRITFIAPIITYLFTLCAGTGHVAYSVLPVIAEVARETGVRPERPMSIAVIASQQAITASPIAAATVALLALLSDQGITLANIMMICIPSTFIACMIAAFVASKMGKELSEDPEYLKRLEEGLAPIKADTNSNYVPTTASKIAVVLFLLGAVLVVLFGSVETLRPAWEVDGELTRMSMPITIEIVMLVVAAVIMIVSRPKADDVVKGSVFQSGMTCLLYTSDAADEP